MGRFFKSRTMEEKWDIYLYNEQIFFCRSWGNELIYRAAAKFLLPTLTVSVVDSSFPITEKVTVNAVRDVDFLFKSHLLSGVALHPLPAEYGSDEEKLAHYSFSAHGRRGVYGTMEETIGTSYF
jgi:hypothetical protein